MLEELIDIVAPSGRPLCTAKPRSRIHRLGLWHETVHVWIVNSDGMILFQKRSLSKESYPGLWDVSAAGHISSGETAVTAARREVRQELGLHAAESELCYLFTVQSSSVQHNGLFVDNEFNRVYLIRKDIRVSELKLQKSEVDAARFFHLRDLEMIVVKPDPSFAPHPDEYGRLLEHFRRK